MVFCNLHSQKHKYPSVILLADSLLFRYLFFQKLFMRQYFKIALCIIVPTLFLSVGSIAQKTTIYGYVFNNSSGERLSGASILVAGSSIGTSANNYGFYSISFTKKTDSVTLIVSYAGFETQTKTIKAIAENELNWNLQPENTLEEVVITSVKSTRNVDNTQMSSIQLSSKTIKSLPAFLGETDVLKAIQLLPGVQSGSEGSSGLYVRGGGPDQNLILLDGVPVYNASHLFGFFSVFNADAIKGVDVIKGGFPARYGGRLSSVIDVQMKEGNNQEFHGEGGIGLIASRLTIEGPLKKNKASYMISGRRTYADFFMRPISKAQSGGDTEMGYFFYDLNAKVNMQVTDKDHFYLSGYFGNDRFTAYENTDNPNMASSTQSGIKWGNATAVARWNHRFNKLLFANFTANYTRYQFDLFYNEKNTYRNPTRRESYLQKYFSGIKDYCIKADFDWLPLPNHVIKFGAGNTWHTYKPGAIQAQSDNLDTTFKSSFINNAETDIYIEDDFKISDRLKINSGLHYTVFSVTSKNFSSLQPRLSVVYLLNRHMSLKASFVQMNQFIHLLTNSGLGLPTDLWVPATSVVPPQKSLQYAVGYVWNVKNKFELSVEAYYKGLKNIIEYAEGASFLSGSDRWEQRVETGRGRASGIEFFLQKKYGKTTGMAGYTLSFSDRTFANLNNGQTFPYKYDRRHDIKLAAVHQVNKKIQLSADWVFGSGAATTLQHSSYRINDNQVYVYGSRNGYRLPAYHRLDAAIKFTKQKKKFERSWVISIYNLYNRLNTFYIYLSEEYNPTTSTYEKVFYKAALFPVIPSISYQFKF